MYTPTSNHIGVSRRIESAEERARLRADVGEMRPPQGGFIVRTACEGVSRREIQRDVAFLTKTWASILKKNENIAAGLDAVQRSRRGVAHGARPLFQRSRPAVVRRSRHLQRIVQFVQTYMPRLRARVQLYEDNEPIFDHFKVEPQIERALERKVWLKSGGYLIFDQAEALTAIDVNTGRFVGKRSQDETILKTNLEAVDEVVRQLRLRNIGGIIIVDFIDMTREADRKRVSDALERGAQARQGAHLGAEDFRARAGADDAQAHAREPRGVADRSVPAMPGEPRVKSVPTLAAEVLRGVHREAVRKSAAEMLMVKVSPEVARYLYDLRREGSRRRWSSTSTPRSCCARTMASSRAHSN